MMRVAAQLDFLASASIAAVRNRGRDSNAQDRPSLVSGITLEPDNARVDCGMEDQKTVIEALDTELKPLAA